MRTLNGKNNLEEGLKWLQNNKNRKIIKEQHCLS